MQSKQFTHIPAPNIGSNVFNLTHDVKMSFKMACLVPSCVVDVIPGDKFSIGVENLMRFSALVSPVMHKITATTHFFFVPNRIMWPEWEDFITGTTEPEPPYFQGATTGVEGDLVDYLGFPTDMTTANGIKFSAFPVAAYALIYDEYYRDQNLQTTEFFTELTAGENVAYALKGFDPPKKRAWNHDYFTACLPFEQKGDAVSIPLVTGGVADVEYKTPPNNQTFMRLTSTGSLGPGGNINQNVSSPQQVLATTSDVFFDPNGTLEVDLNATANTINTLRQAFKLQEWLEKNARGGTRYIENTLAHFGVMSSDKRLNRPEYIGGLKQHMTISEVLSTAQTLDAGSNTIPLGEYGGHGVSIGASEQFNYYAEEHGWIIGIINVQPDTAYYQGLPKMFNRTEALDYYWPSFAHIGEQAVMNSEVYADLGVGILDGVFGYIPRYSEYKYMPNRIAGEFKSSLNFWHLARSFSSAPALNSDFIECDADDRIFADGSGSDHIYAQIYNKIFAQRKMPIFGMPSI